MQTVDSGTHGDPKPGETSKHVKPFDRTHHTLPLTECCCSAVESG